MKKTIRNIGILLLTSLLLVGCSSSVNTKISDGDEVIVKFENKDVVKQDLYSTMVKQYGPSQVINKFMEAIIEETVVLSDEEIKAAEDLLKQQKEEYADNFENMYKGYGYESEEDYYENVILNNKKNEKLLEVYLTDHYETVVESFSPKKLKYMTISSEEAADRALELLKESDEETAWDEVVDKFASEPDTMKEEKIMVLNDHLQTPEIINTILKEDHDNGLIEKTFLSEGQYYIFEIIESDPEAIKEEVIAILNSEEHAQAIHLNMLVYYANAMNLQVHDTDVYNGLKDISPELFD